MTPDNPRQRLIAATEAVICRERTASGVTTRAIAAEAGMRLSAIGYHFGSLEALVVETGALAYRRFKAERMAALHAALERHRPAPPPVAEAIEALIGPSVRWALDPASAWPVFEFLRRLRAMTTQPELYRALSEDVAHHDVFIDTLARAAPWLRRGEVGWRLNAALGVRSQVLRHPDRSAALARGTVPLDDPAIVTARIVEVVVPMFARPEAEPRPMPRPPLRGLPRIRTAT